MQEGYEAAFVLSINGAIDAGSDRNQNKRARSSIYIAARDIHRLAICLMHKTGIVDIPSFTSCFADIIYQWSLKG